jgi:hypothetical protein
MKTTLEIDDKKMKPCYEGVYLGANACAVVPWIRYNLHKQNSNHISKHRESKLIFLKKTNDR